MSEPRARAHRAARPRHGRRRLRRAARRARRRGRGGDRAPARGHRRPHPRARATSTRSSRGSDLIVELIGGTDPAREYVLAALRAGQAGRHRQQAAARPARRRALRGRPRGRRPAALRGRGRRRDPGHPGDPGEPRRRPRSTKVFGIVNGTTNFILTEMAATGAAYEEALARAQELGYAEADPTDDVSGADAAAKMAILARLAFHTPVTLDEVPYEGIEAIQPDDLAYAKELGLSLKLLGVAERRDGGDQRPRLPLLPLRRPPAGAGRAARSTRSWSRRRRSPRSRCRGRAPAASRPPRRCSATSSRSSPATPRCTRPASELPIVADVASAFYLHLEVADQPGRARPDRRVLGDNESRSAASSSAASATTPAW